MLSNWMASVTGFIKRVKTHSESPARAVPLDQHSSTPASLTGGRFATLSSAFTQTFRSSTTASLKALLESEREARIRLEAQCSILKSELERANERLDESLRNERLVYQTGINVNYQQKYGFSPFPDAPKIPDHIYDSKMPHQIPPDYIDLRSEQAAATARFRSEMVSRLSPKSERDN